MDDLNSVISSILGDPQKMEQLRSVAQSLGMNPGGPPPAPGTGQDGGFSGMGGMGSPGMSTNGEPGAGGMNNMGQAPAPEPNPSAGQNPQGMNMNGGMNNMGGMGMGQGGNNSNGFNLGSLSKLAGMFGNFNNTSDKNVQLLRALQPHISTDRAGRIDDAVRIMQLMSAWPAIRDSGLLGSLGNLFSGGGHK